MIYLRGGEEEKASYKKMDWVRWSEVVRAWRHELHSRTCEESPKGSALGFSADIEPADGTEGEKRLRENVFPRFPKVVIS